jgi:prephenate dehydrogenase
MDLFFDKTAIIGVGLLGGSAGLALKAKGICGKVVGLGRSRTSVDTALAMGAIDEAAANLVEAVEGADLIIVCTPVGSIAGIIADMESMLDEDCIVTDVGSTKRNIVDAVEQVPRARTRFVGGHPLAGSERKGVQFASAELFEGATILVTPTPATDISATAKVQAMWERLGGRVLVIDPVAHDHIVARTSHLPHVFAALLVTCLRSMSQENVRLMGKGFLDTTRIASSDPEMWADICTNNVDEIQEAIFSLRKDLEEFEICLNEGDYERILEFFEAAKRMRDSLNNEINSE